MPGPIVTAGERVTLRTAEREDLPFLQRVFANPDLRYPMGSTVRNQDELAELLDGSDDPFVVCLADDPVPGCPDDPRPIGQVTVSDADWKRPELTYWLVPEFQGDGYGSEAVSLAVDYAFRTYDHPAVEAKVYDFNDASRGLLESLGFQQEGRLRKRRFVGGAYRDAIQYGLLREEWDPESWPPGSEG